jgi:hypothetical protein
MLAWVSTFIVSLPMRRAAEAALAVGCHDNGVAALVLRHVENGAEGIAMTTMHLLHGHALAARARFDFTQKMRGLGVVPVLVLGLRDQDIRDNHGQFPREARSPWHRDHDYGHFGLQGLCKRYALPRRVQRGSRAVNS